MSETLLDANPQLTSTLPSFISLLLFARLFELVGESDSNAPKIKATVKGSARRKRANSKLANIAKGALAKFSRKW